MYVPSNEATGSTNGVFSKSRMVVVSRDYVGPHQGVLEKGGSSLDHQAEFVTLVSPIFWKATLAFVVVGEFTNFRFSDFQGPLVVDVLVISRPEMVDDANGLSHQIHHVLRVGTAHVVLSENLANALAEDQANVRNGVFVSQDRSDFSRGHTGFAHVQDEGLNGIFVGVGPCRSLGHMRTGRATLAFSGLVHTCHFTSPSGFPTYLPFLTTPHNHGGLV